MFFQGNIGANFPRSLVECGVQRMRVLYGKERKFDWTRKGINGILTLSKEKFQKNQKWGKK